MDFPSRPDFKEIEKKWIAKWTSELKYVYTFDPWVSNRWYVIDTPPPFPSGDPHMGHILGWVWMDFIARYKRMKGYNVYLPQGWDVHGLPIELKVEKKLKISKENVKEFIEACRKFAEDSISKMREAFMGIGFMADWDKEYRTMDIRYKALTQKTVLQMFREGLIYRGKHPITWCPNCETAVAAQEIGYIKKKGKLVYIKLPLKDEGYIEIATTRPEFLPACIGIFVHPEDERYKNYIGKTVIIPLINREVPIIADPDVDPEFGTGAVWVCTYGDPQDIIWQKRYNLPVYQIISKDGRLINTGIKEIEGLKIEEAREKIIEILKEKEYVTKIEEIEHNVIAHTERADCKSPIEFIISPQWYIKLKEFKEELLEIQKQIKFYPERLRQRLIDWINSLEWDWVISRQRLWGCPLPFWICKNCEYIISAKEEDLPVDPGMDKPPIDKCPKCGGELEGVKDVLDGWVESSITPIAILVYAGIPYEKVKEYLPTNLREQGYEIIRTWLFYTLFRTYKLTGKLPWKEALVNGMVLDERGRKMSKSLGNVVDPLKILKEYPADAIRYWGLLASHGDDHRVRFEDFDSGRAFLIKIWNLSRFIWLNTKDDEINLEKIPELKPIDIWILSELSETVERIEKYLDEYKFWEYVREIRKFVWDLFADNYLELVKYKIRENDYSAKWTLLKTLRVILGILTPMFPFTTEEIYSRIFAEKENKKSIHETEILNVEIKDEKLLKKGKKLVEAISIIRKERSQKQLKYRDILESVKLPFKKEDLEEFEEDLKKGLNVQELKFSN